MKTLNTKIGTIVTWYDFIRSKKNKNTGNITYDQHNTKTDGYSQRYIGVFVAHNNDIFVAVAVNKKEDNSNWWRYIIENRISAMTSSRGHMNPEDKGCTMVPMAYKDLLYKDSNAYNNLYGLIDPTMLDMAIAKCTSSNQERIDVASRSFRENTKTISSPQA
jgi:hypothetical protein